MTSGEVGLSLSDDRFGVLAVGPDHRRLFVRVAVARGEVLAPFRVAVRVGAPHRHTLQIGDHDHGILAPPELRFVDHHCSPSAFFDVALRQLIALVDLAPGAPVTAFYPATEWAMAERFDCRCGAPGCLGLVGGASELAPDVLARHRLSPHVARRLAARLSSTAVTAATESAEACGKADESPANRVEDPIG